MWKCVECGTEGNDDGAACRACAFICVPEAIILHPDGKSPLRLAIDTRLNRSWAQLVLGEDAMYWDSNWQMAFERRREGWFLCPNPAAPNETLLEGKCISEPALVAAGQRVAVGRAVKGIEKTRMTIAF